MALTDVEKAWMAGFVDGEGCMTITKNKRRKTAWYYRPVLNIVNTDLASMQFFSAHYTGAVSSIQESRTDARNHKWNDYHRWNCPVLRLREMLNDIIPFLRVKRKQADILLRFLDTRNGQDREPIAKGIGGRGKLSSTEIARRELLREEIRHLNTKGLYSRSYRAGVTLK